MNAIIINGATMTAAAANFPELKEFGEALLSVVQQFGHYLILAKALYETIQCALKGDKHKATECAITYGVIWALLFFLPKLFDMIEKIFK